MHEPLIVLLIMKSNRLSDSSSYIDSLRKVGEKMQKNDYIWFNSYALKTLKKEIKSHYGMIPEIKKIDKRIKILEQIIESVPYDHCIFSENDENTPEMTNSNKKEVINCLNQNLDPKAEPITFIIIVKNEESVIKRCLNSIYETANEIIIVDTGSTDQTLNLIKEYKSKKIKLFHKEWNNDFSKIRNFGLEKSKNNWVFFIDCDEVLEEKQAVDITELINLFNTHPNKHNLILCPTIINSNGSKFIGVKRIFLLDSKMYYYGAVHEYPTKKDKDNIQSISLNIKLFHDGYEKEAVIKKNKVNRNLTLGKQMIDSDPTNGRWYYFYARDGFDHLKEYEIEQTIEKGIQLLSNSNDSESRNYLVSLIDLLMQSYFRKGDYDSMMREAQRLEEFKPNNSNTVFFMTLARLNEIKRELRYLLEQTVEYRENHSKEQYGMLHPEGYHIDFLIGALLFENGKYDISYKYFNFLKDKFRDEGILKSYSKQIANMEKLIAQLKEENE